MSYESEKSTIQRLRKMRLIRKFVSLLHSKWAVQRFEFFRNEIHLQKNDTILDLGGYDGNFMKRFKHELTDFQIIVADIDIAGLEKARLQGFKTLALREGNQLPFKQNEIDCIFCNSVLEHITIPKNQVWKLNDESIFHKQSIESQSLFAKEIRRCGKKYIVQTPHKYFPIESHTWLPLIYLFPRRWQIKIIKVTNKFWIKKTKPDWNLLTENEIGFLFPDAKIFVNKKFGFPKEIIAIKN